MRILVCLLIVFSPTLFAALTSQHGTDTPSSPPAQIQAAAAPKAAAPKAEQEQAQATKAPKLEGTKAEEPKL